MVQADEDGISWSMEYIPCSISSTVGKNDYHPTPYAQDDAGYQRCLRKLAEPWIRITAEEAAAKAAAEAAEAEGNAAPTEAVDEAADGEPAFEIFDAGELE